MFPLEALERCKGAFQLEKEQGLFFVSGRFMILQPLAEFVISSLFLFIVIPIDAFALAHLPCYSVARGSL